jgi:hypothetical protein
MKSADKPKQEQQDGYMSGTCQRCFRIRTECQKVIDSGKRCTEKS